MDVRRVRATLVFAIVMACAAPAVHGHPGVGIVFDSKGNLYYTDLAQVWRIAPDGRRTIAVANVHTHELSIDAWDNLYGEHLWYEGEATDRWWHYFWRRSPDGRITRLGAPHAPFRNEDTISLVRDASGNSYRVDTAFRKILRNGQVIARANFRGVHWMTVTPRGVVYLIDDLDLVRVTPAGRVETVARDLSSTRMLRPDVARRHALMGLWTDGAENVYVADYAHGLVKRVTPRGEVSVAAESRLPWSASGGAFAPNGDLWLLEYSVTNAARVRKIGR